MVATPWNKLKNEYFQTFLEKYCKFNILEEKYIWMDVTTQLFERSCMRSSNFGYSG
jgi:hypothetical protein